MDYGSENGRTQRERLRRTPSVDGRVRNLIVIGGSAGGQRSLPEILKDLSVDVPAAVIILVHAPARSCSQLPHWLTHFTHLPVVPATDGAPVYESTVYVAPPGTNVLVQNGTLQLQSLEGRRYMRRAINDLFVSAAKEYGDRVVGVVLSGLWKDGSEGLAAVHQAGGVTIVQNPNEAQFRQMPANAMSEVPVTFCLNFEDIGLALDLLVRRKAGLETGVSVSVRLLKDRVSLLTRLILQSGHNDHTVAYLREELISLETDLRSIQELLGKVSQS